MVKVYYFDMYGKGEPIRMILTHAKVEFEDVRISHADWPTQKKELNLEFGQVPAVEMDGTLYTQSASIVRALGKMYGYYPEDPLTAWKVDSLGDALDDVFTAFMTILFRTADEEAKKVLLETFTSTTLPAFLAVLEKRLKENTSQTHIVGDSLTTADFLLTAWSYSTMMNGKNPFYTQLNEVLKQHHTVHAYLQHMGEEFKQYLATRPSATI
jgi:glutathione S-transferase